MSNAKPKPLSKGGWILIPRHNKYVVVQADKASNNIVFVCKTHYINCLIKELGINSATGNPTYTRTDLTKDEILSNHKGAL